MTTPKTELLKPGLRLLFIGFNPSPTSAQTGWNYAGPNNRFYRILHESGLTDRLYAPSESRQLFDKYDYGFTNLVLRPTPRASDVTAQEYREGATRLRTTLETYQPTFACFVGKGVYQQYARKQKVSWGFQPADPSIHTRLFVAPGTSGLVRMKLAEQVAIYRQLAEAVCR
ncbi:mismatch-specific DNA-glycosylase [Alicyclobacillus fastidiosus]|uniref:Mismatch-specific DNA-glycosylase n=1 Tax=Alicyclobacillus fastidiosus TaxID=392011 RepID=A0ABV5AKT9_9BACL|nr:mismatch-specific DNA-glycosylase [Alicyclobacillus fastidiosus]WEH10226.1 mismatch-specific DNA-glycosylase [Alicyclobacillus fastidiosus]